MSDMESKISITSKKFTSKLDEFVNIIMGKEILESEKPVSITDLFNDTVSNYSNHPALVYQNKAKEWNTINFGEYKRKVMHMAKVFIKLGLLPRTSVGIISFNCPEWFYTTLGSIHAGGITTGIYATNSPDAVRHVLESSDARIVVVDNAAQMDKIKKVRSRLPNLKSVIQINGPFDFDNEHGCYKWEDLEEIDVTDQDDELIRRIDSIFANECCTLIFTSGTTGYPKAAMLSHDNITFACKSILKFYGNIEYGKEVGVSYLPLNHVAGLILDIFIPLHIGGCVYFADRDALKGTLIKTLTKARPTRFLAVPRVWEKFHEKLFAMETNLTWINSFILRSARNRLLSYQLNYPNVSVKHYVEYKISIKILQKIKDNLGLDRCKTYLTGAAPISPNIKEYFLSINIKLREIYGMTESILIAGVKDDDPINFKTSGSNFKGLEMKISNPNEEGHGEICSKGRSCFMGYLHRPEQTKAIFDEDRWLRTGDVGYIDKNNQLYLTGRRNEIVITAGGENIPPAYIEDLIKNELPGLSNVVLIGDRRKFLTVLVTIKTEMDIANGEPLDKLRMESLEWMKNIDLKYTTLSEILAAGPCGTVLDSIQYGIDQANEKAISNAQRVQKFVILPHDFSIGTGELGPTLKLKRFLVHQKYAEVIDSLYK